MVVGVGGAVASTVYGTVVVMATLTATYEGEKDPWKLASAVAATVTVLWLAHVYAHTLAQTLTESRASLGQVGSVARHEVGILLAAVLPFAALVFGALGVFREASAVWVALAVGLVTLAAEGIRYARLEGLGLGGMLAASLLNVAIGLVVVLLKVLVQH